MTTDTATALPLLLRALNLGDIAGSHEELARRAEKEGWSFVDYLRQLVEGELEARRMRRITRNQKRAGLPPEKTLGTLEVAKLPAKVRRQIPVLCEGGFTERGENLLAFGLPGRGKTHVCCAIGHELVQRGYRVLFTPAYRLVQRLLAAKRDLELEAELKRLDAFDAVLIDDLGYVQQDREEMEVLFTFLSERYERRSVIITSNLVFSQWDRIFKDAMTTAAAIDRIVHHATILELTRKESYRAEEARKRAKGPKADKPSDDQSDT